MRNNAILMHMRHVLVAAVFFVACGDPSLPPEVRVEGSTICVDDVGLRSVQGQHVDGTIFRDIPTGLEVFGDYNVVREEGEGEVCYTVTPFEVCSLFVFPEGARDITTYDIGACADKEEAVPDDYCSFCDCPEPTTLHTCSFTFGAILQCTCRVPAEGGGE